MDKFDKDLRKDIEDLEKLIEEVKNKQKEEKKETKKNGKPSGNNVIRIDLASRYSSSFVVNLIVSFLINAILIYLINLLFHLATVQNSYVFLILAAAFTVFEEAYKTFLMKKYIKIVLYSSGLIFFLINVVFFYLMDLYILGDYITFINVLYPLFLVILLQVSRLFIKNAYVRGVKAITMHFIKQKNRR